MDIQNEEQNEYISILGMTREEFAKGVERAGEKIREMARSMPTMKRDDGTDIPTILIKPRRRNKTRKNRLSTEDMV